MVCFRLLSSIRPFWFFWSQAGSNLCVSPSCPSERSRLVFLVTGGLEPLRFAILPIGEIAFADVSKLDKGLFWNRRQPDSIHATRKVSLWQPVGSEPHALGF